MKRCRIEDPEMEIARLEEVAEQAKKQLQTLYDKALREVGETNAVIFEVHQMMLEDEDYVDAIQNMIRTELVNADYAVAVIGDNFSEMFANMEDEYMRARAADIKDISNCLVKNLKGQAEVDLTDMGPSIIVADDLSPSETVQMDKNKIMELYSWIIEFPYGDPRPHDEYTNFDRSSHGPAKDPDGNKGHCGWISGRNNF